MGGVLAMMLRLWAPDPAPLVPEPDVVSPDAPAVTTGPVEIPPPAAPPRPQWPPVEPVADEPVSTATTDAAAALGLDLEWRAAPGCPGSDRMVALVAGLLERQVELDPTAAVVIRADVVAEGARWRLDLDLEGPSGAERRRLHADTCAQITDAAALVVATNIDAGAVASVLARAGSDEAAAHDEARAQGTRARPVADRSRVTASGPGRIGLALVIQGGPVLGMAPKVSGWLQGGLHVSIRRAVVGLHAGHGFARRADGETTLRASTTVGGVRGCFVPSLGRLAVPLCGLVELGAMTARAERTARGLWVGAGAGAGLEWAPHPRVALVGGVDALVAITRPQFQATGAAASATTYRAAPAAARATLGIAVRLR